MRRLYIYILALLALSVSCQRLELPEELPTDKPTGAVGTKATITFSTAELMDTETKAIIDPSVDVTTLHLILFDENGMYVETCEATKLGSSDHDDHHSGRHYTVTLTLTDQPRIIHFVANCPVDQIIYGHEASVIGNMYVDKNDRPHVTTYETAYWARIEVPFIKVQETQEVQGDETTKKVSLHPDIVYKFNHVPLLRNYAEITVESSITDKTFEFLGYTVYNVLDRGTVAPYNSNTRKFQSFIYHPDPETEAIASYSYPQLSNLLYEGHALTSAELITDYARNDDGTVKVFASQEPFYIYERKVSVMTDAEEEWNESPPHIIIKGRYNHGEQVTNSSPVYYYKMDLVYTATDGEHQEIKHYNILRNFNYHFYITDVHDEGYTDIEGAISGPAGNNLSGSTTTSKLTNVSDNAGRLWVSYTDTTLVNSNAISLKYKYIPNYYNDSEEEKDTYQKIRNDLVRFGNVEGGDVIASIDISDGDITGTGTWGGYRNVILHINEPGDISKKQILELRTDNVHLTRDVRYTLCKKLNMEVECTPKVAKSMLQTVQVDIKLPMGLTEDMFPLELDIETFARTLSPDPVNNGTTIIPVKAGPSIIDVDGRRGQQSYFYTLTIPTLAAYKALDTEGNTKVYHTYWLTNKEDNASTIYVDNKYFHQASDSWVNYIYTFSNLSCTTSEVGVGKDVTLNFTMANGAYNTPVTISLVGMTYTGTLGATTYVDATEVTYTPTRRDVSISGFKTTTVQDKVSFTLDAKDYAIAEVEGERNTYKFNGAFDGNVTRFEQQAGVEADFEFNIPADAYHDGMVVYVTLNRLLPAESEENLEYVVERAVGDKYMYRVPASGKQTIRLETAEATEGECTVTLEADLFETEVVTVPQVDRVFEFGDVTATPKQITSSSTVTISFKIPADAWAAGQSTMPVNVTLDRLVPVPAENKLTGSNGNYVYNVTKNNNNSYSFNVRPSEATAGSCKVTLNADGFNSQTIDDIEQIVVQSETVLLETNFNNGQVTFNGWGNNSTRNVQNGQLVIYNPSSVNQWEAQFAYDFGQAFVVGKTYKLTFRIRGANGNGTLGAGLQNADDDYHSAGEFAPDINFTGTWQTVEVTCTCNYANAKRLIFSFGQYSGSIYIDDFKFTMLE